MEWDLHSTRRKDIALGISSLTLIVNLVQQLTQGIRQWLAQLALAYLKFALIVRTDLLTYATLADTQQSFSETYDDSILHTHHLV